MAEMLETTRAKQRRYPDEDIRQALFSRVHDMQLMPELVRLITNEKVFPKIVDIVGTNIGLFHAFPPCTRGVPAGAGPPPPLSVLERETEQFPFHRDAGLHSNREGRGFEFPERPSSRMTVKAIYYLSDCSEPHAGNTWVVPGSHLRGSPGDGNAPEIEGFGGVSAQDQAFDDGTPKGQPEGAIPVRCKPGSALVFDRRLLHAATPNFAEHERLLCIIGWGPRWIRPVDGMYVEPAMRDATCPVVRQLLGATTSSAGLYLPTAADTPLRAWIHEHGMDDCRGVSYDNEVEPRQAWQDVGLLTPPSAAAWQLDGDAGYTTAPRHPERAASGRLLRNPWYRSRGTTQSVEDLGGGKRPASFAPPPSLPSRLS